jgi:DNA polymerase-1
VSTALLDGDIVAFRAAAIGQREIDWGDGEPVIDVSEEDAIKSALAHVEDWRRKAKADKVIICLSDRSIPCSSFRYTIHPYYKRNRNSEKPQAYDKVVEVLCEEFKSIIMPRLEADDVMGIWGTNGRLDAPVIVSLDKDMLTVPGRVLIPNKMQRPVTIRKHAAMLNWMKQTLTGDTVDNYKGCPGIGPKRAEALLTEGDTSTLESTWEIVWSAFEAKGKTLDEAISEARCARILKANDYNPDTEEIRLWHPKEPKWVRLAELPKIRA